MYEIECVRIKEYKNDFIYEKGIDGIIIKNKIE
jgi:hypothetical protein